MKINSSLPVYLAFDASKGIYRLKLVNGIRKSLGKDRDQAIQIAVEYNRIMRPSVGLSVDELIKESGGIFGETTAFSGFADHLLDTIIQEESPSKGLVETMSSDIERIKTYFFDIPCSDITLEHVNDYLNEYHHGASANVYNRKISFLEKLFAYAVDQSLMEDNPASRKKKKRLARKVRQRLSLDAFNTIHASAPLWLQTAMDLSLQTTQARLEISRIKYSVKAPKLGQCGCVWLEEPKNGIYGTLFIHRQKVQEKEAAHVAIPIGEKIKAIIEKSRDGILCPYVVHRRPVRDVKQSKETDHKYQLDPNYLSRSFSKLRDMLELFDHLEPAQRPTYHEIRALSARLFTDQGIDPQGRMAHTDSKSTKVYIRDHLEWTEVPHAEINKTDIN